MAGFAKAVLGAFLGACLLPALHASDTDELSWVKRRVAELQPAAGEKRFDEIGWAADIREAKRLAKAHGRAVFLFTHDGRINIGRC